LPPLSPARKFDRYASHIIYLAPGVETIARLSPFYEPGHGNNILLAAF